jgi:multiple sugar transport system permease protein
VSAHSRRQEYVETTLVVFVLALFLWPVLWLLETSLKFDRDVFVTPPRWLFFPTLDNFQSIFAKFEVGRYLTNSVIISLGTAVLSLLLGVPAGYAVARATSRVVRGSAYFFLAIRMIPPIAALMPFYLVLRDVQLLGSYWGPILLDTTLNTAFVIWMTRTFFNELPVEIEEASACDGCSRWQTFFHIALPLSRPSLVTSALFCLLLSWNDFLFALLLTSPETKTLPVALLATFSSISIGWGQLAAFSIITMAPVVVIGVFLNRYLVSGLASGSTKG